MSVGDLPVPEQPVVRHERVVDEAFRVIQHVLRMGDRLATYAEVTHALHATEHAEPLLDRLAPWSAQVPTSGVVANEPVSYYLGGRAAVLGRHDEADASFARAAAFYERAKARSFAARTNLWWGQMLVERDAPGEAEPARALLTDAHATAVANGYAGVERRAVEALQHVD